MGGVESTNKGKMKSKYQKGRIEVIDRELSKKNWVKTSELRDIVNDELDINITTRTIQKDLEYMLSSPPMGYGAPIKKDTKNKGYCYTDRNFSIRSFGLRKEDINALLFYSKTLNQYQGIKIFEDIAKAIEKVLDKFKIRAEVKELIKSRIIVQAERMPPIKGHEYIQVIAEALQERKYIEFTYNPFGKSKSKRVLAPCLIKEDLHLWYVLGFIEGKDTPTTFALDRMSDLKLIDKTFDSIDFNSHEYFKYSFGVTVIGNKPIKVILSFTPQQGNYIKALPIHPTQQIIKDNSKELKVSVMVKPSYEFYSKILGYGEGVKVVSPPAIVKEVKETLKLVLKSYK